MDARRRARRCVLSGQFEVSLSRSTVFHPVFYFFREAREQTELAKRRAERPKIQQQFADLKRGLSVVTDEEWEGIPEVGNLTRKKRRREERSYVVPDSVIVGDRGKGEYENALDARQQESGGFETPAELGQMTNFVEIGQAQSKILTLKLDQVRFIFVTYRMLTDYLGTDIRHNHIFWIRNFRRPQRISYFS
jgi:hypothetical protein